MCFPAFIPPKQERAAALAPRAAVCPDLIWKNTVISSRSWLQSRDQAVAPHRDTKSQGSPVAQQPGQRGCHLGLPAVRSQVSGSFGAMPAPPDGSRRRSQAGLKVRGLRQGARDKRPQGNGGVSTTSLCLCHRDLASGGAEPGPGVPPLPGPRDVWMLRARRRRRRSAGPRWDIDCGDTTGHGGGRVGPGSVSTAG